MKNKMFKVISSIFAVVILLLCINVLFGDLIADNHIHWLEKTLKVLFAVSIALLILCTIVAAILSVRDCIRKEGRQYVDKFLLKIVCIFVLLYMFRNQSSDYARGIIYPALIWIVVPRAYDYITTNE